MTKTDEEIIAKLRMKKLFNGDVVSQAINLIERLRDQLAEAQANIEELQNGKQK